MQVTIAPKLVGEIRVETIDLSSLLVVGQSVTSATAAATVYSGTDASPPAVVVTTTTTSVFPVLSGGVLGVIYAVRINATATSPSAVIPVTFYLAIIPDLP